MIVKRADFITSMKDYGDFATKGCPEVAFAGKSNVGKSSMINKLTNRNKLARTSATPGKTRLINVYQINNEINFIDLPGYGFAKVSKDEKLSWGKMMQDYFATTEDLCHVFHLVDIRHEPSAEDKEMGMFLRQAGIPFTVVATKADKLSKSQRAVAANKAAKLLGAPAFAVPFSAEEKIGKDALTERIGQIFEDAEQQAERTAITQALFAEAEAQFAAAEAQSPENE